MDNNLKKVIKEEWLKELPMLSAYTQNKFYKIIGCFICGIELVKLSMSDEYRPHLVIYPLYKENVKSCLDYPSLMCEFYNSQKLQLNLSFKDLGVKLKEAINIVSNTIGFSEESHVPLDSFYNLVDIIKKNESTYITHSGRSASLLELKFYAALYIGDEKILNNVINDIHLASKSWNMQKFNTRHGNFDLWLQGIKDKLSNRKVILNQIEVNKQDKKIAKLKSSELIL